MPVPSDITALSAIAASNSPLGSESPATADDYFRAHAAFIAQLRAVIGGASDANIPNAYATIAQVIDQSQNSGTTAGTSTAYTLTPATALTSYAAGKTFWVTFHAASGASPTIQISGVATPPALVKQQFDGTYAAIAAGDIPLNHRSRVTLISSTQALVESLPAHSDTLNTTRIDIASASTVNLTTGAPNTRHINITGTTTIAGFTVAVGQAYFVRFNAALTLTNNANIVTQSGANITAAAGDTCILRATAANVVEVLSYTPSGGWANTLSANGYQKLPSGLIVQWVAGSSVVNTTQTINFPITFPTACLTVMSTGKAASGATGSPICGIVSFSPSSCVIKVFDAQNGANAVQPYIVAIGY